jgi:hypothetical protein
MTIVGAPGSLVWFWVGPTTFTGPVNEFNYVLNLNIEGGVIATETTAGPASSRCSADRGFPVARGRLPSGRRPFDFLVNAPTELHCSASRPS